MHRFEFGLERVLRLKQQQEQLAELHQQRARSILEAAIRHRERIRSDSEAVSALAPTFLKSVDPLGFRIAQVERLDYLRRMLVEAEMQVQSAQRNLIDATARRVEFAKAVEAMRTLRSHEWDRYRRQREHHEQEKLEELALQRWRAKREGEDDQAADRPPEDVS